MINKDKILAIIPARGGSKRVKDKNIRDLAGKPLIQWSIDAAKGSKYIDDIFVSTDSSQIQDLAERLGVTAKPLRPQILSTDNAKTEDVLVDILKNRESFDLFILLQPTSPLRTKEEIDEAIELFYLKKARSVVSVCEAECHPSWVGALGASGEMDKIVSSVKLERSQDLDKAYRLNGAIYIMQPKYFLESGTFYLRSGTYAYVMDRGSSLDIDTEEDLLFANALMSARNKV